MTGAKPRNEWLSPQIVLTIVLSLLAAQQAYFNFNSTTTADIATIKTELIAMGREREILRQQRDRQVDAIERRIQVLEARR